MGELDWKKTTGFYYSVDRKETIDAVAYVARHGDLDLTVISNPLNGNEQQLILNVKAPNGYVRLVNDRINKDLDYVLHNAPDIFRKRLYALRNQAAVAIGSLDRIVMDSSKSDMDLQLVTKQLYHSIGRSVVEAGEVCEAHYAIRSLAHDNGVSVVIDALRKLATDYVQDDHVIEVILSVLNEYVFEEHTSQVIKLLELCAKNHSAVCTEALIRQIDNLDNLSDTEYTAVVGLLDSISSNEGWIMEYRDQVKKEMEETRNGKHDVCATT